MTQFVARTLGDGKTLVRAEYARDVRPRRSSGTSASSSSGSTPAGLARRRRRRRSRSRRAGELLYDLVTLAFYPQRARDWLAARAKRASFVRFEHGADRASARRRRADRGRDAAIPVHADWSRLERATGGSHVVGRPPRRGHRSRGRRRRARRSRRRRRRAAGLHFDVRVGERLRRAGHGRGLSRARWRSSARSIFAAGGALSLRPGRRTLRLRPARALRPLLQARPAAARRRRSPTPRSSGPTLLARRRRADRARERRRALLRRVRPARGRSRRVSGASPTSADQVARIVAVAADLARAPPRTPGRDRQARRHPRGERALERAGRGASRPSAASRVEVLDVDNASFQLVARSARASTSSWRRISSATSSPTRHRAARLARHVVLRQLRARRSRGVPDRARRGVRPRRHRPREPGRADPVRSP